MRLLILTSVLAAQVASPIFRFETDGFWLNLHHFLYVLGRAEAGIADSRREAVAKAPDDMENGLAALTGAEQQVWREAVTVYAAGLSRRDAVFDSALYDVTNALRSLAPDARASSTALDPRLAAALDRAAPIYRSVWWPKHQSGNRAWLQSMREPVDRYGARVLAFVTRVYQEPWMTGGFPVNLSAWSNWAGAYSTRDSLLVVSTLAPGNQGLHGFEIVFHEAMHQWDEEIDGRLTRIAQANGLKFNDLLSHAMIFYTTGEAMKAVVPGHVPYAELAGIWKGRMGVFKPSLDEHWKPYLEGKSSLDAALLALLKGSGPIF
jgi:hypothetical protein